MSSTTQFASTVLGCQVFKYQCCYTPQGERLTWTSARKAGAIKYQTIEVGTEVSDSESHLYQNDTRLTLSQRGHFLWPTWKLSLLFCIVNAPDKHVHVHPTGCKVLIIRWPGQGHWFGVVSITFVFDLEGNNKLTQKDKEYRNMTFT